MSGKFVQLKNAFRKKFSLSNSHIVNWYPGHMMKGMFQIQAKLKSIDCVVEVHDARLPFSGRNLNLRDIIQLRPHILMLNKVDVTDFHENNSKRDRVVTELKNNGVDNVYFTSFRQFSHQQILGDILPMIKDLVYSRPRYSREGNEELTLLVVGVPNVGKSTFINSLRNVGLKKKGKATEVGAIAGITKSVLTKIKVSTNPPVYIIDTPGIMPPKISGLETGMRLAACACLPDHLVGEVNIADYILFWLNNRSHFDYVDYFGLGQPMDNILDVLAKIAIRDKQVLRVKDVVTNQYIYRPNNSVAAVTFCTAFREGKLGKFTLDDDY